MTLFTANFDHSFRIPFILHRFLYDKYDCRKNYLKGCNLYISTSKVALKFTYTCLSGYQPHRHNNTHTHIQIQLYASRIKVRRRLPFLTRECAETVENHKTRPYHERIASANDQSEFVRKSWKKLKPTLPLPLPPPFRYTSRCPCLRGEITVSKVRGNQLNADSKSVTVPGILAPFQVTPNLIRSVVICHLWRFLWFQENQKERNFAMSRALHRRRSPSSLGDSAIKVERPAVHPCSFSRFFVST